MTLCEVCRSKASALAHNIGDQFEGGATLAGSAPVGNRGLPRGGGAGAPPLGVGARGADPHPPPPSPPPPRRGSGEGKGGDAAGGHFSPARAKRGSPRGPPPVCDPEDGPAAR